MRYPHISKLNLNLLYYLAVLLEERHITKAAKRCFISQSAMSRHLDRLREALGDDLLIRNGRSHDRSARGERLLRELEPLLPRLEDILQGRGFDPAISCDRFRMAMTDNACMIFLPQLVGRMTKAAPHSEIEVLPWTEACLEDVRSGRTDTVISVAGLGVHPSIHSETIFTDKFVCVVAAYHPLNVKRVTLQQYLRHRHIVIAVTGQQTLVDRSLSDLSLKRQVGLSLPFFAPAISAVADTDMILTLPRRLAFLMARTAAVRLMAAPPEVKGYRYDMMWHPRLDGNPAHSWFREQVRAVGQRVAQSRISRISSRTAQGPPDKALAIAEHSQ